MPRRPDSVRRLLIVAAKVPQAGRVKTRLVSENHGVSEIDAAHFAQAFLRDTLEKAAHPLVPADVWLALDGSPSDLPADLRGHGLRVMPQEGDDLGQRLTRLFEQGFTEGYGQILVIGSDAPHLPPAFLVDAWGRLKSEKTNVVLGPTDDGGYYLIGLKQNRPDLLQNIAWSTSGVLGQTQQRAMDAGLHVAQTPPWYDIDTWDDLRRLAIDLKRGVIRAPNTHAAISALFESLAS